jgi:hypothetical protein
MIAADHYKNHYKCGGGKSTVNSNKSDGCWSGGTGRRTGLKSPIGSLPHQVIDHALKLRKC